MNIDFPAFLLLSTVVTGIIWLLDSLFFAAKRDNSLDDRPEPLIVEYSRSFFPVILVVLVLRSFIAEPFRIPSASMMPTLLTGDFILVNKFAYGLKMPAFNHTLIEVGEPERGDVFVFRYPNNPKIDYIKRAVAIPGDTVYYKNKVLFINGVAQDQVFINDYVGEGSEVRMTGRKDIVESIGDVEHHILVDTSVPDFSYSCQFLMNGPVVIPEGYYFAMGDNRDASSDSRCWGLVPKENLVGRAFAIWMHWDSNRDFPIKWNRLGRSIH